jgi:hypothetical protein
MWIPRSYIFRRREKNTRMKGKGKGERKSFAFPSIL